MVLFGTGDWGNRLYKCLKNENLNVLCFGDNNENKWDKTLYGIEIKSPEIFKKNRWNLIIANYYSQTEIVEQLNSYQNKQLEYITLNEMEYEALKYKGWQFVGLD
jgi:hypothetical protein